MVREERGGEGEGGGRIVERMQNRRATVLVVGISSGAILAGLGASIAGLCEATPSVTRTLGPGFDAFAHAIEPFRSLFLFSTLGLLLLGSGLTYLPHLARGESASALRVGVAGHAWLGAAAGMLAVALAVPRLASWLVN